MIQGAKKKILLLIPNLGRGGAQKVFLQQLMYFSKHHEVTGCVFNWDDSFEEDHQHGIVSLQVPAGKTILKKAHFFLERIRRVKQLKRQHQIDICISHLEGADYVNILSGACRTLCWIHGTKSADRNITGGMGWIRKNILIPSLYRRSELVTVSEGIRQELISAFGLRPSLIRTIYNGIDLAKISEAQQNSSMQALAQSKIIITHCRLSAQKNLFALLDIHQLIIMSNPDFKLVIVGDGELRNALLQHARNGGRKIYSAWDSDDFNDRFDVYFLGYQSDPYPYLKNSDLYLMTSSWEGFPLSLCEAMACGIPVIAADCFTGPAEILGRPLAEHQETQPFFSPAGVLMPPAEKNLYELWAKTVVSVMKDETLRKSLSEGGRLRAQTFDEHRVFSQWDTLLS